MTKIVWLIACLYVFNVSYSQKSELQIRNDKIVDSINTRTDLLRADTTMRIVVEEGKFIPAKTFFYYSSPATLRKVSMILFPDSSTHFQADYYYSISELIRLDVLPADSSQTLSRVYFSNYEIMEAEPKGSIGLLGKAEIYLFSSLIQTQWSVILNRLFKHSP